LFSSTFEDLKAERDALLCDFSPGLQMIERCQEPA
jgi:hypothetical protein